MRAFAGIIVGVFAYATVSLAGAADDCGVVAHLVQADAPLARVAAALKNKSLSIVVAGTASSTLPGAAGPAAAYPARLEAALQKKYPAAQVKVTTMAKPRQTAAEMAVVLPGLVNENKAALVVWQIGTADAIRGVSADEFQTTLDEMSKSLQKKGVDLILVNPQYSPRTDAVVATAPYAEAIRWVANANGLNVFDRQAVMRQWSELGTFDLNAATKSLDTAMKVHDCIGQLLASLVIQGVAAAGEQKEKTSQ
jgi:hypothetical protein